MMGCLLFLAGLVLLGVFGNVDPGLLPWIGVFLLIAGLDHGDKE